MLNELPDEALDLVLAFVAESPRSMLELAYVNKRVRDHTVGGRARGAWASVAGNQGYLAPEDSPHAGRRLRPGCGPYHDPNGSWMAHARRFYTTDLAEFRRVVSQLTDASTNMPLGPSHPLVAKPCTTADLDFTKLGRLRPQSVAQILRQCIGLRNLRMGSGSALESIDFESRLTQLVLVSDSRHWGDLPPFASRFPELTTAFLADDGPTTPRPPLRVTAFRGLAKLAKLSLTTQSDITVDLQGAEALQYLAVCFHGSTCTVENVITGSLRTLTLTLVTPTRVSQIPAALLPQRFPGVRSVAILGTYLEPDPVGHLDLRPCVALERLKLQHLAFSTLDLAGCDRLKILRVSECSIQTVTLGSHPALDKIDLRSSSGARIDTVDASALQNPTALARLRQLSALHGFELLTRAR